MKTRKEILEKLNFKKLSIIQEKTIEAFPKNQNLVIVAPTGTGKTHSYLIPIFEKFQKLYKKGLKLVILIPTNELVFQVTDMVKELFNDYKVRSFYGSMDRSREIAWLERNEIDIAIGTPSKIKEFIELGALSFSNLEYLVFDEADMMFEIDFASQIAPILKTSKLGKLILVSATISLAMQPFIKEFFGNYILVDTTKENILDITHYMIKTGTRSRLEVLERLLKVINPFFAIIFVSKKENQDEVYNLVSKLFNDVGNLSGNMPIRHRRNLIRDCQDFKIQYLVTSDIASRGLDFTASHIINFDFPYHLEYFIHRAGRTGRMGQSGDVYSLVGPNDHRKIQNLERRGIEFKEVKITRGELTEVKTREQVIKEEEIKVIQKVRKPKKVKPNYKKKYQEKVEKELKEHRRKQYAKNRKSR
ncbi:MAG: DEAD/DEAH box helicase [Acholeplasmataceae bacterium]|nr:DEAD/DEAH box helicase [Acholeplasmataceae bacterium]